MDLAALIDPGLQPELLQRMPPFRESVIERTVRTACRRRSRRPESRSLAPRALLRPLGRGRRARSPNVRLPRQWLPDSLVSPRIWRPSGEGILRCLLYIVAQLANALDEVVEFVDRNDLRGLPLRNDLPDDVLGILRYS